MTSRQDVILFMFRVTSRNNDLFLLKWALVIMCEKGSDNR